MSGDRTETGPFSVDELAVWRGFLRVHALVVNRLAEQMERSFGLTLTESEVLLKLAFSQEGRLPLAQLGTKTYLTLSASGLSRLVDRLRRRGLVEREPVQDGDRRSAIIRITERGREAWTAAAGPHQALVREIFLDPLTDEQRDAMTAAWDRLLRDEPPIEDEPAPGGSRVPRP